MKQLSRTQEKTRQRFLEAFFAVRTKKPLEKITVRDIVSEAGYNRSSFYLYFTDVYALADAAENSVLDSISEAAEQELSKTESISLEDFMRKLAHETSDRVEEIYILSESKSFRSKFVKILRPNFAKASGLDTGNRHYEYIVSLFFSIMLHNISYWAEHRDEYTLSEVAEISRKILLPGIRELKAE